jgi:hypothetical protein
VVPQGVIIGLLRLLEYINDSFFNCCLSMHVDDYTIIVPKNALVY